MDRNASTIFYIDIHDYVWHSEKSVIKTSLKVIILSQETLVHIHVHVTRLIWYVLEGPPE